MRRIIAALLAISLIVPLPARAAMLATDSALGGDRERIGQLLDRTDVLARLQAYGVSPSEVKARVAALTDAEAAELAERIEALPAGGVGVLGAALIVFLVLLLTDILGYTKVFPFTRPMK
ncbi:MAG TPA: PA2779 family protein [Burkholderiales bacterium]|nr:PA2779 family protein [Burkholderiales bacterium]